MQFTSLQRLDDVIEREFTLGEIRGILWTPIRASAAEPVPLILAGQPGGAEARTELRDAVTAGLPVPDDVIDRLVLPLVDHAVPDWRATLDALLDLPELAGPVGFSGGVVSIGVRLAAVDDRIAAAVLFAGSYVPRSILEQARGITIPLYMLLQWDDEGNDRQMALELFDALGSREKTLNANLGGHTGVPRHAGEDANRFFVRHLLTSPNTGGTDAITRS